MRSPGVAAGAVTVLCQAVFIAANLAEEYAIDPQAYPQTLGGTGPDYIVRSETVTSHPQEDIDNIVEKISQKRGHPQDISGFWKREGYMSPYKSNQLAGFWKRNDEFNRFWKRQNTKMGFWKRALFNGWDTSADINRFWKRGPSHEVSFWKRAYDLAPKMSNFWKKSLDVSPRALTVLKEFHDDVGPEKTVRNMAQSEEMATFLKRANVPWNMLMLPEYKEQLYKANQKPMSQIQESPLPPKNRRKGPKYNPDFNPTGW